ncbi:hypothetical protein SJA_C1-26390 [Sphingobium indicum UT26S]|uniref:Uncharacterized protein n=1 Tax=Sphingobium indicum (strain DSM 16413 / CCM 7287 / MTCC 6362 / UT26 / NBRC 101211 / UT26S) TaxID=452662 RepID=D4Z4E1_SPHIU|nr:hypothetical protein SJA_C1-26390 [Sphingobium indicum UT26S]
MNEGQVSVSRFEPSNVAFVRGLCLLQRLVGTVRYSMVVALKPTGRKVPSAVDQATSIVSKYCADFVRLR